MTNNKSAKGTLILAATLLAVLAFAACSDNLTGFNKYFSGRTLTINVVEIDRAPEIRYAYTDPADPGKVTRYWRLLPSEPNLELVLVRMKVENHKAVKAVFELDVQSAQLRDFTLGAYFPINLWDRTYEDLRNQAQVTIRMEHGECKHIYISEGTTVGWLNEDEAAQFVTLEMGGQNFTAINPGETYFKEFSAPGQVDYKCSTDGIDGKVAQVVVVSKDGGKQVKENFREFIFGSFDLRMGMGIEGWVVFEAPIGTKFRDLRWLAGDSITVTF